MITAPASRSAPRGFAKLLALNWALVLLLLAAAAIGFLMLVSVAGGEIDRWAEPQMIRFAIGFTAMFVIAMIHIRFWRAMAPLAYLVALGLLVLVEVMGTIGMGAQRWIDLGFILLQPSELMKVTLVMVLAAYYHRLDPAKVSRPLWIVPPLVLALVPVALVLKQPDLGTAILLLLGAGTVMFLAGVSLWYFGTAAAAGAG
jgi:rod shape determining protein RodA